MDLETENRLAAMLMQEAQRLRQQAEKEGVGVYLRQPQVRGRPNSRFLSATVLGVQQANRAVEINEMWRAREKELELDSRLSHRQRRERNSSDPSKCSSNSRPEPSSCEDEDEGLRDEEVEEFLQSRMKRGRGAVGSRMDEPGPYPICTLSTLEEEIFLPKRQVLGPEKPPRQHLEKASTASSSHGQSSSKKRRQRRRRRLEDTVSTSDDSSPRQKKKKRRHRHQSR